MLPRTRSMSYREPSPFNQITSSRSAMQQISIPGAWKDIYDSPTPNADLTLSMDKAGSEEPDFASYMTPEKPSQVHSTTVQYRTPTRQGSGSDSDGDDRYFARAQKRSGASSSRYKSKIAAENQTLDRDRSRTPKADMYVSGEENQAHPQVTEQIIRSSSTSSNGSLRSMDSHRLEENLRTPGLHTPATSNTFNSLPKLVESRSQTTAAASETCDQLPTLDHNAEKDTTGKRIIELQAELQLADNLAIRHRGEVESFSVGWDIVKSRMGNDNRELSEKADTLETRLGEVEIARNASNAKVDDLIEKVRDLKDRLEGHEETINVSLTQPIESKSALIKRLDECKDELNDTKNARDASVAQVHELQAEKHSLTKKNGELQEELNIVKQSRGSSLKTSSLLIAADEVFSHRGCNLEELVREFQKVHNQSLNAEISRLSHRMEILRAQVDQPERERDLAEKTHINILEKFELQREQLQQEFSSLLLEKMNATTNLQVLQGRMDEVEKARQYAERQAAISADQVSKLIEGNKVLDMRVQGILIARDVTKIDAGNPWQHFAKDLIAQENHKGTVPFQAQSMREHDLDYESTNDLLVQIQGLENALAQEQNVHRSSMTQLSQAELKVDTLEASLAELKEQERSQSSPEAVESIIQDLRSSLAVEVTAHKTCQLRLASVKATLKDLQRSVAEEASEKKATNAKNKANSEVSPKSLKSSLENERKTLQICHHKLVAAEARANEQAASNAIHLEKIANLENKLELWRGLVDVGIVARVAYWQSAKTYCDISGNWSQDRGSNIKSKSFIAETRKTATARPHIAADAAMFLLGVLSEEPDRRMFFDIYQTELCSTIREQAHPRLLAEIATSKAAVRERSRAYGLVEEDYKKSGELLKLEKKCLAKYLHMSSATGSSELKAIQDAFDEDQNVKKKVERIQQIADSAIRNSR